MSASSPAIDGETVRTVLITGAARGIGAAVALRRVFPVDTAMPSAHLALLLAGGFSPVWALDALVQARWRGSAPTAALDALLDACRVTAASRRFALAVAGHPTQRTRRRKLILNNVVEPVAVLGITVASSDLKLTKVDVNPGNAIVVQPAGTPPFEITAYAGLSPVATTTSYTDDVIISVLAEQTIVKTSLEQESPTPAVAPATRAAGGEK